jgi:hypothetical protein
LGALWIFSATRARVEFGDQSVLRKVHALMDWPAISVLRKNGWARSGRGPQGYKQITLFKCLLIGQWHNLSDPKLEQGLRVRFDFRLFGLYRTQYFGVAKTHAQMVMAAISQNLLKAANKILLNR